MKICTQCKIEKDESEFGKDNRRKDKLKYWCKICDRAYRLDKDHKRSAVNKIKKAQALELIKMKTMKICLKCNVEKDKSEFHKQTAHADGLHSYCKPCSSIASSEFRRGPSGTAYREREKIYFKTPEGRAQRRKYHQTPNSKRRNRESRWERSGIKNPDGTPFKFRDYEILLMQQNGVCSVCGFCPGDISLHAEHDHETGIIRGLLCLSCNHALALVGDDASAIPKLEKLLEYMRRFYVDRIGKESVL